MAHVENLSQEELGTLFVICGELMMDDGLLPGAALDGSSRDFIRKRLGELLKHHEDERLDELACIDAGQVEDALTGTGWGL